MPVLGARVTGDCDHRKAGGAGGGRGEPGEAVAGEGLRATQAEDVRAVGGGSTKEGQDLTIALMLGGEGPEGTNGRSWEATAQKGRAGLRQAGGQAHSGSQQRLSTFPAFPPILTSGTGANCSDSHSTGEQTEALAKTTLLKKKFF